VGHVTATTSNATTHDPLSLIPSVLACSGRAVKDEWFRVGFLILPQISFYGVGQKCGFCDSRSLTCVRTRAYFSHPPMSAM